MYEPGEIIEAAEEGDIKKLQRCISLGANVNERGSRGVTALVCASLNGHREVVDFLIDNKANPNNTHESGESGCFALFFAACRGHKEVCASLLAAGSDKNFECEGKTAAQGAAECGYQELSAFIASWGEVRLQCVRLRLCDLRAGQNGNRRSICQRPLIWRTL